MLDPFPCPRCGYVIHADLDDCFATCPQCEARNVRRTSLGLGWQELTGPELNRLEVIDLRWHKEKDNYRVYNNLGSRIPSVIGSILGLLTFVGIGIFLIWKGRTQSPAVERDQMIGLFLVLLGGGYAINGWIKACQYRDGYRNYLRHRFEAVLQPPAPQESPPASVQH